MISKKRGCHFLPLLNLREGHLTEFRFIEKTIFHLDKQIHKKRIHNRPFDQTVL